MVNFISDFVLLAVMIMGVLQKRNATYLWNMLYFQALFWILAATLTELPSVVCLSDPRMLRGVHHISLPRHCLSRISMVSPFSIWAHMNCR
jgi:hypothetical protein